MPHWRKGEIVSAYSRSMVELADADVRSRHPDWSDRRIRVEAAKRWLPPDLHAAAFGPKLDAWNRSR
jgi:hypothetical protein